MRKIFALVLLFGGIALINASGGCSLAPDPYTGLGQAQNQAAYYSGQLTASAVEANRRAEERGFALLSDAATSTQQAQAAASVSTQQAQNAAATNTQAAWWVTVTADVASSYATAAWRSTQDDVESTKEAQAAAIEQLHIDGTATQQAYQQSRDQYMAYLPLVLAVLLVFAIALTIAIGAVVLWKFWLAKVLQKRMINGRLVMDDPEHRGHYQVVDPDLMFTPMLSTANNVDVPPEEIQVLIAQMAFSLRQVRTIMDARPVEMKPPRIKVEPSPSKTLPAPPARPMLPTGQSREQTPEEMMMGLPGEAPWTLAEQWNPAIGWMPLGINHRGIIKADHETFHHFLYAGMTGSGKSSGGLRPLTAFALAAGWQVIVLDWAGLDFQLEHPNLNLIKLGYRPENAIQYLHRAFDEIHRRQEVMVQNHVREWTELPEFQRRRIPNTLIVIDEFSNVADTMNSAQRSEFMVAGRGIASEGRKSGIHIAVAVQDPTARTIDIPMRRNMVAVCFPVRDADASRVVIDANGGERLQKGQFLARAASHLMGGVSFNPSHEQLESLIWRHPAPMLPAPEWLEKDVETRTPEPPEPISPKRAQVYTDDIVEIAEKISGMYGEGASKRRMAEAAGGTYAGGFTKKIDQAIDYLDALDATTTTPDSPTQPFFSSSSSTRSSGSSSDSTL